MTHAPVRLVQRYAPRQRLVHWVGVGTFLALLITGIVLIVSPLAPLAAGGASRFIHRIAIAPFLVLPIAYAVFNPRLAGELLRESFTYTRDDLRWFKHMPAYFLGRTRGLPPQGRINAGQKIHHAATFLMFNTVALSGFVLMLDKGQLGPDGLASAAMVHDVSMMGLTVLMIGHLYFTFVYDALSSMVSGFVSERYARMEHAEWVRKLPENAFVIKESKPKK